MQGDLDLNNNDLLNVKAIYVDGVNVLNVLDNVTVHKFTNKVSS